jgi:hypothetical protein
MSLSYTILARAVAAKINVQFAGHFEIVSCPSGTHRVAKRYTASSGDGD